MLIESSETLITGKWLFDGERVVGDESCKRIQRLLASHLIQIGNDASGWDALYRDPSDGRLWERIYYDGGLHGGGPPLLRTITFEEARQKYPALEAASHVG